MKAYGLFPLLVLSAAVSLLVSFGEAFHARPSDSKLRIQAECCLQPLYYKKQSTPESENNLIWLKERYNLTDKWLEKAEIADRSGSASMSYVARSVIVDRMKNWKKNLKLTDSEISMILEANHRILNGKEGTINAAIQFLMQNTALTKSDLRKIFLSYPTSISFSNQNLQEKVNWIQDTLDLVNDRKGLASILRKHPQVLSLSPHENLQPTFNWFQERLGLSHTQTAEMIRKQPTLLGYNVENSIEPKIRWFEESFPWEEDELGKVRNSVAKQPGLLKARIETLERNLQWLKKRLDLSPEDSKKIFLKHPTLLVHSAEEKIEPNLQWLEDNLGLDFSQLRKIVVTTPALLSMSIPNNLQPTLDLFRMYLGKEQAADFLKHNHVCLNYSLEGRYKPRLLQLQERGLKVNEAAFRKVGYFTSEKWKRYMQIHLGD
jgi:mTERF